MNHWHTEKMAEFRHAELIKESEQIRLANLVMQSRAYHPGLFTRTMHSLAGWMILKGKELHARYEIPGEHSHQKPSSSFAR
jgi:hypothetical protein